MIRTLTFFAFVTLLLSIALLGPSGATRPASAATFNVTRTGDGADGVCDADCSLREAIIAAAAAAGDDDTVTVPAGVYTLTITGLGENASATGDLDISEELTINGAGAANTIIEVAGGTDRALHVRDEAVTLTGVTIRNGKGGLGDGAAKGGAILVDDSASLLITNSVLTNNQANDPVEGSEGGAIYNEGILTVTNTTVIANTAFGAGGGIFNAGSGVVVVNSSTFSGNSSVDSASGAIHNDGTLTINNSTFADNHAGCEGGAIRSNETLIITGSTFSGNSAVCRAGAILSATTNITNSTISGNTSLEEGGGLQSYGPLTMTNVTIANNSAPAGGGFVNSGDIATLTNVIIAGNSPDDCAHFSPIPVSSHNLDSDATCGFTALSDHQGADPMLGPLADNGGLTMTHALLPGSEAIDVGDNVDCPQTDQRGRARPVDGDGQGGPVCDIGAFELHPGDRIWGDLLCDGSPDSTDALAILRFVAKLPPLDQNEPCPDIGTVVLLD